MIIQVFNKSWKSVSPSFVSFQMMKYDPAISFLMSGEDSTSEVCQEFRPALVSSIRGYIHGS
jgi:hypothetical protein